MQIRFELTFSQQTGESACYFIGKNCRIVSSLSRNTVPMNNFAYKMQKEIAKFKDMSALKQLHCNSIVPYEIDFNNL